jgi:hypothetical protein
VDYNKRVCARYRRLQKPQAFLLSAALDERYVGKVWDGEYCSPPTTSIREPRTKGTAHTIALAKQLQYAVIGVSDLQ